MCLLSQVINILINQSFLIVLVNKFSTITHKKPYYLYNLFFDLSNIPDILHARIIYAFTFFLFVMQVIQIG